MRSHNLGAVLSAVTEGGLRTRGAIAQATGLHKSSVGDLAEELARAGVLRESRRAPTGTRGRPSTLIDSPLAGLGLEVRADAVVACVSDVTGRVRHKAALHRLNHVRRREAVLDDLADLTQEALSTLQEQNLTLIGATLAAAPGSSWSETELRDRLGVPITVRNANTLSAWAEVADPHGAGLANAFYIAAGGEITARFIARSEVLFDEARNSLLDVIGHLCVDRDGYRCACGRRGCLAAYVNRASLLRRAGLGDGTITDLIEYARADEPAARAGIAECGRWLGVALANVVNLFAPPAIVLGGDLALLAPWIVEAVDGVLAQRVVGHERRWLALVPSRLGADAAVHGAAAAAFDRLPGFRVAA